jgi:hypothetical protein
MIHAGLVLTAIVLCLACAFLVRWVNAPMFTEPRADGTAAAVRPVLEHRGVPITDPAAVRAKVAALVAAQPRNGVLLPDRLRDTAPVTIDGRLVPRWYEEWEQGWRP